jgi:hypothetical protein
MDKIKREVNDCNKEVVKELTNLYNKLSDSIDKSYYYGQKSGYEEILAWFKQSQNNNIRYVSPKKVKNYLIEKGAKSKLLFNDKNKNYNTNNTGYKEDTRRKFNKANFNYLFYNQTFNNDTNKKSKNEQNIFPTNVENSFKNSNLNNINNSFNSTMFNNFSNNNSINQPNNILASINNNNLNNNCFIRNNIINNINSNDSEDEQMKPNSPLRTNVIQGNINLKRKKNS